MTVDCIVFLDLIGFLASDSPVGYSLAICSYDHSNSSCQTSPSLAFLGKWICLSFEEGGIIYDFFIYDFFRKIYGLEIVLRHEQIRKGKWFEIESLKWILKKIGSFSVKKNRGNWLLFGAEKRLKTGRIWRRKIWRKSDFVLKPGKSSLASAFRKFGARFAVRLFGCS